jgi:hypothetical protein
MDKRNVRQVCCMSRAFISQEAGNIDSHLSTRIAVSRRNCLNLIHVGYIIPSKPLIWRDSLLPSLFRMVIEHVSMSIFKISNCHLRTCGERGYSNARPDQERSKS